MIKRLVKNDFSEKQAEEVVSIIKEVRQADLDIIATRKDLKDLETSARRDLRKYCYKTVITLGIITAGVGGIIIAILHR